MRTGTKEIIERSLTCATAIRAEAIGIDEAQTEAEVSQAIVQAVKTVFHETDSFPPTEFRIRN